jgi:hypothetical protein
MKMVMRIRRKLGLLLSVAGLITVLIWLLAPGMTFGKCYRHAESGNIYEFREGRVIVDGKDLGRYEASLFRVRLTFDTIKPVIGPDPIVLDAAIGWNTLSMPIPKYGESVLKKE